jgi:lipid A 3-O-deacylase
MRIAAAFLCLSCSTAALAQPASAVDPKATITAIYENDKIAQTDRQYTNGVQLSYLSATTAIPSWMDRVRDGLDPVLSPEGAIRWGLSFGQNLYTPDDTLRRSLITDDRPYAAWTYLSFSLLTDTGDRLDTLGLDIGWIGTAALGEEVQNNVHRLMGVANADGWDNQLDNEPGINFVFERRWRRGRQFGIGDLGVDATPHVSASLGNIFTYAATGIALRIGDNLPADYGPPRIRPSLAGAGFFRGVEGLGWYLFAALEGRAVLRDVTLDGNTFRDSHNVSKEPFVGEAQLGFALTWNDARLAFTYDLRTQEFEGQDRNVRFGSISLSYRF